jgi:hypothetical protein
MVSRTKLLYNCLRHKISGQYFRSKGGLHAPHGVILVPQYSSDFGCMVVYTAQLASSGPRPGTSEGWHPGTL